MLLGHFVQRPVPLRDATDALPTASVAPGVRRVRLRAADATQAAPHAPALVRLVDLVRRTPNVAAQTAARGRRDAESVQGGAGERGRREGRTAPVYPRRPLDTERPDAGKFSERRAQVGQARQRRGGRRATARQAKRDEDDSREARDVEGRDAERRGARAPVRGDGVGWIGRVRSPLYFGQRVVSGRSCCLKPASVVAQNDSWMETRSCRRASIANERAKEVGSVVVCGWGDWAMRVGRRGRTGYGGDTNKATRRIKQDEAREDRDRLRPTAPRRRLSARRASVRRCRSPRR